VLENLTEWQVIVSCCANNSDMMGSWTFVVLKSQTGWVVWLTLG